MAKLMIGQVKGHTTITEWNNK